MAAFPSGDSKEMNPLYPSLYQINTRVWQTEWSWRARRYCPACVIDAVCPAMVTSVDRCAPVFAGMNSST